MFGILEDNYRGQKAPTSGTTFPIHLSFDERPEKGKFSYFRFFTKCMTSIVMAAMPCQIVFTPRPWYNL